jgi:ABC-type phosphate transport system substrate-binding protein
MKPFLLQTGLLSTLLFAGAFNAVALDGAVVIANAGVPTDSLSADELKDIYTAKTKYWDNGQVIVIVLLPKTTDAALQQASGMEPSQFKTLWLRLAFSGRASQPRRVDDAVALVALVAATKGAIALVPADAALPGVKIVAIK